MPSINSLRTYFLNENYAKIKQRASRLLTDYLGDTDLISFDDADRSVTYSTEKLIPTTFSDRPRVMLLFSNPHPHSVQQGMFLSPGLHGQEHVFWPIMSAAGWMTFTKIISNPHELADMCLDANYNGPFDLIFYCYYAFPTQYPEHIRRIFGKYYFSQMIEPEAMREFRAAIQETSAQAVVTFNKGIFNLVSTDIIKSYVDCLKNGELIQSRLDGMNRNYPVFLTYPTGWRFHSLYRQYRTDNMAAIRAAICSRVNAPENKNR
jgi:hypothetical protein